MRRWIFYTECETGDFLCRKNGRYFCNRAGVETYVCNPKRARKVLDEIASPNLQIIFDPVNLLDISNYQNRDVIIEEAIELLGDDIAMVHMKDFVVQDGKLVSVAAGTGEMNYEKIIRFIKERKPYIHVTLENTTPENAVQSKEYIQGLYDSCRI